MTGPIRLEGGPMDGGYRCGACGQTTWFEAATEIPPCANCGGARNDYSLFMEEWTGVIYPSGTFVRLDGGELTAADFARARRWRRARRAWSWLRYGWRR